MSPSDTPNAPSQTSSRGKNFRIFGAIIAVGLGFGLIHWLLNRNDESTDDAYIDGDVIQLAPQIGGRVIAVHFTDNEDVKAGDVLVEIDPRDAQATRDSAVAALAAAQARVEQAKANLAMVQVTSIAEKSRAEQAYKGAKDQVAQAKYNAEAAKAELERAKADTERYRKLYEATFASHQKLEQVEAESQGNTAKYLAAQAASASAESAVGQAANQLKGASTIDEQIAARKAELSLAIAQEQQAEADLTSAELNLSYTKLATPLAGRAAKKSVAVGDMVQKGQVLTQVATGTPWVLANFKETQLVKMRPNQKVTIAVDAFPDMKLHGHVQAIQPGTGSRFSLFPAENATGNFIKIVQRVPVKIDLDDVGDNAKLLVLGLSVYPTVDVSSP